MSDLSSIVADILDVCIDLDRSAPPFKSFKAGIGPYGEPQLVKLIADHLNKLPPYARRARSKRTPDLLVEGLWALEFKLARPFGDNGLEAESWSVNLLHPYPGNVSVFGDCLKLADWKGPERRAAVVLGYEHEPAAISLDPLFAAFEAVASRLLPFELGPRMERRASALVHPVHQVLRVTAWEIPSSSSTLAT